MKELSRQAKLRIILANYLLSGIREQMITMDDVVDSINKLFKHGKCIDCGHSDTCHRIVVTKSRMDFDITYCSNFKEKS